MKVALVCDPLTVYGGAERVIEQILLLYPQADLFAVLDVVPDGQRGFLGGRPVRCSFLQRIPGIRRSYRALFALWPLAVEQLDVTAYDLVISSHHSVAYGVLTRPDQPHVSYVHAPMRYAWDLQHEYLREAGIERGPKSWLARRTLHAARLWDFAAAQRPSVLAANSHFVAQRLRRTHRREARVIHPPVATGQAAPVPRDARGGYYLSLGRLVPYKRTTLLAQAFARMPERRLRIVGDGPETARIAALRAPNVELLGRLPGDEVRGLLGGAEALVYAGIEDFGIAAVEAQALGTPVIAHGRGGLAETVRGLDHPRPTGVFFDAQSEEDIIAAVAAFEADRSRFTVEHCVANAARFAEARFRAEFKALVEAAVADAAPAGAAVSRAVAAHAVPARQAAPVSGRQVVAGLP